MNGIGLKVQERFWYLGDPLVLEMQINLSCRLKIFPGSL